MTDSQAWRPRNVPALLLPLLLTTAAVATLQAQQPATASRADRIVTAAIARREAQAAALHDYEYRLSVKWVVQNLDKPQDSASSVAMINEMLSRVEWQPPHRYVETVIVRRHSNKLGPVWNTVSVHDIGNFQRTRIDILPYSLSSPIAGRALKHYRYRVVDSSVVNGRKVLRLSVLPRSSAVASFTGFIEVLDSTFDVVSIDLGVNDAVRIPPWKLIRFQGQFADAGDGRWMPHTLVLSGEAHLPLSLPRTPRRLVFEQRAWLDEYRFNTGARPVDLAEVRVQVEPNADTYLNPAWSLPSPITRTPAERQVWAHKDSSERRGIGLFNHLGRAFNLNKLTVQSSDFFHFNRVDGAYAGVGASWRQTDDLGLTAKIGYGMGTKLWQERAGATWELSEAQRFWIGAYYHDETINRPGLVPHHSDRTVEALLYRRDPLDYYRERGQIYSAGFRPFNYTRFELDVTDMEQTPLPVATEFSLLKPTKAPRPNGPIVDGRMRTIVARLTYDSRQWERRDDLDKQLPGRTWNRVVLSAEVSEPGLLRSDFKFGRYSLEVERHQKTGGLGFTTLSGLFGITTGTLPPQRYIVVDAGVRALGFQGPGLKTLGDSDYAGSRIAMISVHHDFDRLLFSKSGIPGLRGLPFTLKVYATSFIIDFANHVPFPGDSAFLSSPRPYTEAGFALGNLLPFLAPFSLAAQFTWQLSSQSTRKFQVGLGLTRP